jgi:hypothetical protein
MGIKPNEAEKYNMPDLVAVTKRKLHLRERLPITRIAGIQ